MSNTDKFVLNTIARLNKQLSKRALHNDLKTLDNTMYVKVLAKLSTALASRELKRQFKQLDNLYVNVGVNTDKEAKDKIQKNIQMLQQSIAEIEIGLRAMSVTGKEHLTEVKTELTTFTDEMKASGLAAKSTGDRWRDLTSRAKDLFSSANIVMIAFEQMKKAVATAIDLDKAYTDLMKTTNESDRSGYADYLDKCNRKAQQLATTQQALIEGATEFSRSGYDLSTSEKLTEKSTVLANVGEMSVSDSAKAILSGIQAYDAVDGYTDAVDKAQALLDKYNELGNTAAISSAELARGVQAAGSVLADANTDVNEFLALLSSANREYQDADSLALALRTCVLRIRGASAELAESGEDIEDVMSALENQKAIQALTGVDIFEKDGKTIRSMYDIFRDLSNVYQDMSDTDQSALFDILAGKHSAAGISAVLNNMAEAEELLQKSLASAGSAQREYDVYLESTKAHLNQFQAKLVETYASFINGDLISHTADLGTALLDLVTKTDLLRHGLIAVAAVKIGNGITAVGGAVAGAITQMHTLGNALQQVRDLPLDDALREKTLKEIGKATKNLTEKNLKLLLSQKQLNENDRTTILIKHNLNEEQAKEKLETLGLTAATNANTAANTANAGSVHTLKGAFTGLTASVKATWAAMSMLQKASIVFAAASTLWSIASAAMESQKQKAEEAAQALEELSSRAKEAKSDISTLKSSMVTKETSLDEIAKEYAQLAQGVDLLTNSNKSLSTDKYQRFLELNNQLSDLFPSLTKNYDENGNAILGLSGNVDAITSSLYRLLAVQKAVVEQEILDRMPDIWAGYQVDRSNAFMKKEHANSEKKFYTEALTAMLNGEEVSMEYSRTMEGIYEKLLRTADLQSEDFFRKTLKFDLGRGLLDAVYTVPGYDFSSLTNMQKENIETAFAELTNKCEDAGQNALSKIKGIDAEMQSYLYTWLNNELTFQELKNADAELGSAIQQLLYDSLDCLPANIDSWDDAASWFENNILFAISHIDDESVSKALADIYSGSLNSGDLLDAIPKVQAYFGAEHPISVSLQTKVDDIEPLINNVKEKLMDEFDDNVGELTLDKLQIAAEQIEVKEGTLLSWTELLRKIKEVQSQASEKLSAADILSPIESLSDGLMQLGNIYTDISDKGEFDWSAILNNDSFQTTFGNLGKVYEDFIKQISNAPDDIQACQNAFDSLAAAYINSAEDTNGRNILDNVTESTKAAATAMLKQQGIANAEEIITERLTVKKLAQKAAVDELNWATETGAASAMECVSALLLESGATDTAKAALFELIAQESIFSDSGLDVSEKISALGQLATAFGLTAASAQQIESDIRLAKHYGGTEEDVLNAYYDKYTKTIQQKFGELSNKPFYVPPTPKPTGGAANGAKDAAPDTAPVKETAETLNWIDKKLETAAKLTDKLAKAFDRAFGVSGARETYKTYLAQIEAEIGANETAAKYYQDRLRQIGLSYEWIAKIQTGDFSVDSISDENLKAQIGEYRTYSDKLTACYDTLESLEEKRLQAAVNYAGKEIEAHEKEIAAVDKLIARRKALVALKELFHVSASKADLSYQQKKYETELDMLEEQNRKLLELMRTTTYGDEAWQKYNEQMIKNTDTAANLVQTIAELAVELANLPLDKYEKFVDDTAKKDDLYSAKEDNAVNAKDKNKYIDRQIANAKDRDKKAQSTAKETGKNVDKSVKDIEKAKGKDYSSTKVVTGELGPTEQVRKKLNDYYDKVNKYTKSKKKIPESLITEIAGEGYAALAKSCLNYNAALAANDTAQQTAALSKEETQQEIADRTKQKSDNIADQYDRKIYEQEQKQNKINNQIAAKEAKGRKASVSDYEALIKSETQKQNLNSEKAAALQKNLDQAVADGTIKKGSEQWNAMVDAINDAKNAGAEAAQTILEYQNTIRQIKWDAFDNAMETVKRTGSEADYYINRMSGKKLVDDETGKYTEHGTATLSLHRQNYESYLAQAAAYQNEYDDIRQKIKTGELSAKDEAVIQRQRELEDAHRDAALAAEDELEAIEDLVRQGYETQLTALGKLIDRYKELKNSAADAYGYQKQVADKVKTIAALQKQLTVLKTGGAEETRAQIQKLKVQLQDARDDLRDTQYEKYVSDAEEMLDDLLADYEEYIDEKLSDANSLLGEISGLLGDEGAIIATLKELDKHLSGGLAALINGDTTAEKQTNDTVEKEKKEAEKPANTTQKPAAETAKPKPVAETAKRPTEIIRKNPILKPTAETTKPAATIGKRAAVTAPKKSTEKSVSEKVAAYLNASSEEEAQALVRSGEALAVDENIRQLLERAGQTPVILETPDIIKNGFPPLPSPPAFLENLGDNIRVETGKIDIVMNGVNDVETFGRQLREEICRNGKTTQCIAEAVSAKQLGRGIGSARLHR